jgi:hypothetical protein
MNWDRSLNGDAGPIRELGFHRLEELPDGSTSLVQRCSVGEAHERKLGVTRRSLEALPDRRNTMHINHGRNSTVTDVEQDSSIFVLVLGPAVIGAIVAGIVWWVRKRP